MCLLLWYLTLIISLFCNHCNAFKIVNPSIDIPCPPNENCIIECDGLNDNVNCQNRTIYCNNNDIHNNYQCIINCTGGTNKNTCSNMNIYALNTTYITINCIGMYQCNLLNVDIILYDSLLSVAQIYCNGNNVCNGAKISLTSSNTVSNHINNIINGSRQIELLCIGLLSCSNVNYLISSINYIYLNCDGDGSASSCYSMDIIYTPFFLPAPSGILQIECNGVYESCAHIDIVAINAKQLIIDCNPSIANNDEQCKYMQIYPPLYPFDGIISDENYYSLSNVNNNSFHMNCNSLTKTNKECYDIEIYSIYGEIGMNLVGFTDKDNEDIFCSFDFSKRSDYLDTSSYSDFCQNINDINTEIISAANNYNIITPAANDLIIQCPNNNKTCYIYSFDKYYKVTNINCPSDGISSCILTCIQDNGCKDSIINASYSNQLTINFGESALYLATNAIIYAPNNGELRMIFDGCQPNVFLNGTIYAENTSILQLMGYGESRLENTNIFINYFTDTYIQCNTTNNNNQCKGMNIYIKLSQISHIKDNNNPIPSNILIVCGDITSCKYVTIHIIPNQLLYNEWNCTFQYVSHSNWSCDGTIFIPTNEATIDPTMFPTKNPIITSSTISTTIFLNTSNTLDSSDNNDNNEENVFIELQIIVYIFCGLLAIIYCICCIYCIFYKKDINSDVLQKRQQPAFVIDNNRSQINSKKSAISNKQNEKPHKNSNNFIDDDEEEDEMKKSSISHEINSGRHNHSKFTPKAPKRRNAAKPPPPPAKEENDNKNNNLLYQAVNVNESDIYFSDAHSQNHNDIGSDNDVINTDKVNVKKYNKSAPKFQAKYVEQQIQLTKGGDMKHNKMNEKQHKEGVNSKDDEYFTDGELILPIKPENDNDDVIDDRNDGLPKRHQGEGDQDGEELYQNDNDDKIKSINSISINDDDDDNDKTPQ